MNITPKPFMVLRSKTRGTRFRTLNGEYRTDWYEKLFEGTDKECIEWVEVK